MFVSPRFRVETHDVGRDAPGCRVEMWFNDWWFEVGSCCVRVWRGRRPKHERYYNPAFDRLMEQNQALQVVLARVLGSVDA